MKPSLFLLASFFAAATSAMACPEVTGKYLCPKEAANSILGTRDIELGKSPLVDIYTMKVKGAQAIYELNSWNPGIDPRTGDVDFRLQTRAECKDDLLLLRTQATEQEGETRATVEQIYEVRRTPKGILLRSTFDGDEFFRFECEKI